MSAEDLVVLSTVAPGLPEILHGAPPAVLLVDVDRAEVTYANGPAVALAGRVRLPIPVDAWSRAAGLRELGGTPLDQTSNPLSRIAAALGGPGEPVQVLPGEGAGEHPAAGRLMWVTAFRLEIEQDPQLARSALVVLLDVAPGTEPGEGPLRALRERAVLATDLSFTISDPHQPDNPLVWVNPAFTRVTGYPAQEAVGRNCRFLQGEHTDPQAGPALHRALLAEQPITITLLNYRRDGTTFWNQLSVSPVYDGAGRLVNFVGVQADVTERVRVELEREAAYVAAAREREQAQQALRDAERARLAAQRAQQTAERAQRRLGLIAEATSRLAATLDVQESLDRLASLVVPLLADWCLIALVGEPGRVRYLIRHHDPAGQEVGDQLAERLPAHLTSRAPVRRVLASGTPVLVSEAGPDLLETAVDDAGTRSLYRQIGLRSLMAAPLIARGEVIGVLSLVIGDPNRPPYTREDLTTAVDLARRAALTVDNARLFAREHSVAEALQRSLLPELPTIEGVASAARYLAANAAAEVGGDWYDLLALPDGSIGLAVGDVMGHDLSSAAAMGQLRSVLRGYAWDGDRPSRVLERLDRLVHGLGMAQLATAVYARLVLDPHGGGSLTYANAGHLPPLLASPDGAVLPLDESHDPIIGLPDLLPRTEGSVAVPPGSTLLFYTDGLVERRDRAAEDGIAALARVAAGAGAVDLERLCDRVLAELLEPVLPDDVALLAVRLR